MKSAHGKKHLKIPAMMFLFLFFSINTAQGQGSKMPDAKLKIEKIALFKNGLGFFTAAVTLPENEKTLRFGQLPIPSFGTFWVGYPSDVKVHSLITAMEDREEKIPLQTLGQILQANAGRRVTLRTGFGDKDVLEGIIVPEITDTDAPELPNPYFMDGRRQQDQNERYSSAIPAGNVLLIKTDKGIIALNASSVLRADFGNNDILTTALMKQKCPSIRLELDSPAKGKKISLSYLARGVTWTPGYLLDLSDAKIAKFSAQALIVNELTDFNNVRLELVTGFPNIKFAEVSSPVAMSQSLADFLNSLSRGQSENVHGGGQNMITQQAMFANTAVFDAPESPLLPEYSTAATGTVSEDLFLYPVENFTLKRGETAWLPLFTAEMPYKHIYNWKIKDFLDPEDRYRPDAGRTDGKIAEEVWHSCRLVNNLKMPLTTAAAEFVTNGSFTGQDICYYTAPGAETTIRINRAMNVQAEEAEVEVERSRNAATFHGYSYDLVKVKGELKLRSWIDKSVQVEVCKELSGQVLEKLPAAKDVQTAKGLKQVNPKHILTWELELQPGAELKISYIYQVYIRD
jgi:hypothetical protein